MPGVDRVGTNHWQRTRCQAIGAQRLLRVSEIRRDILRRKCRKVINFFHSVDAGPQCPLPYEGIIACGPLHRASQKARH